MRYKCPFVIIIIIIKNGFVMRRLVLLLIDDDVITADYSEFLHVLVCTEEDTAMLGLLFSSVAAEYSFNPYLVPRVIASHLLLSHSSSN